ncbi:putative transposase [Lysobacter enzymogenes]|nr:putative transposase [Lysobacter enzymogenes]
MRKREAARDLVEVHARPVCRSCDCVGLSEAAWYQPLLDWTVRDAELIAAPAKLVEERPRRGFWKCHAFLRRSHPQWNHKRIHRVCRAMRLNLRLTIAAFERYRPAVSLAIYQKGQFKKTLGDPSKFYP